MQAPTLTTDRLILAPLSLDHWEAYAAAWANPQMTAFIGGQPRTRTESWGKFLAAAALWQFMGYGYWSFLDRATGKFLGNGGLASFERGIAELEGVPEAGWAFIPEAWGKGLATEAMTAVLKWADGHVEAPEVRCIIDPGNRASRAVAEKLGFRFLQASDEAIGRTELFARQRGG
ncbi:MAG: GNAT family N-acetyltransferase [Sphingomonadales bacterium]|jgi:RimJ/RimL family protein N-acetyltransferase|nr:GNAT family N-acetyltransferase [Sphingomonadales bacterium]MBK9267428.1 GNAT family N-acetyltransferase [Sphingomonadales bacterium]MBP6433190.1 GNAT family N-acetyltransferase [Sphingorhabdus sp.]